MGGLNPVRLPVWVTTDLRAAKNAVRYKYDYVQNPSAYPFAGIVYSEVTEKTFILKFLKDTRPYPVGFGGVVFVPPATETVIRNVVQVVAFNLGFKGRYLW